MSLPLYQVDAFADGPFTGNPAAVVLLDEAAEAGWMQQVAAEMNLSETAFVRPIDDTEADYELRWFTPGAEVQLCGHATLATAHTLWSHGGAAKDRPLRFRTLHSGVLSCVRREAGWIAMDFPADPATPGTPPDGLLEALGIDAGHAIATARSRYDWLVEVAHSDVVSAIGPDFGALSGYAARGFIVTASAAEGEAHDYVSRFFAPSVRVNEDPVTGSAHCVLGAWWTAKLERHELAGYQASARGGVVRTTHQGDRVELAGKAVTVVEGTLIV